MALRAGIDGIIAVFMAIVLMLDGGNLARQWEIFGNHRDLPQGQVASATVNMSIAITLLIIANASATSCITRVQGARAIGNRSEPPGIPTTITS